jgi:hypothetical protein
MRRFSFLEVVLVFLTVVLVVLSFVAVIVIAYPQVGDRAVRNVRDSFEAAFGFDIQKKATDLFVELGGRARAGWEHRIKKIPSTVFGIFKGSPKKIKEQKIAERREETERKFLNCTKCHKDLLERRAFNHIYIDHRLHDSENVRCGQCHEDIKHPKPAAVREEACLRCHKKLKTASATDCKSCHTPGSIFSDQVIAKNKTEQFFASRKPRQLMPHGFEHGKTPQKCANCHDVPEFCNKCHLAFHKKLPNWRSIHGPNILAHKYNIAGCIQCHKTTWCATKCHSNPGRQAKEGVLPVPTVTLPNL